MTRCEWCERFAATYQAQRRCCQVRLIALMPVKRKQAALDKIRREKGPKTAEYAEHLAALELDRWRAYRATQAVKSSA